MQGVRRRWSVGSLAGSESEGLAKRLLRVRSGDDERRRRIFERPELRDLHPPGALPGAAAAGAVIARACRAGRRISIYGDYDVDGISATAVLWHLLGALSPERRAETFLPHRMEEGYGLNADALRSLAAAGTTLVVTVDCGITAAAEARVAEELGIELVITDHHALASAPGDGATSVIDALPRAAAIAHPSLPGELAPFPGLCGAAVAWKVACATASAWFGSEPVPTAIREVLVRLLPLVALGTIADVMELEDENRILATVGLRGLRGSSIPGLAALVKSETRGRGVDAEDIGFRLAPMLNACGRLGHAAEALELLTSADEHRAVTIVRMLSGLNEERKRLERLCADSASREAVQQGMTGADRRVIVLSDPGWHEGVVGVACSRLVERFGRPVLLLTEKDGGTVKGSGRSVPGVHLLDCLRACRGVEFLRCGGHAMAAGMEISKAQLPRLIEELTREVNARLESKDLVPQISVDCRARLDQLSRSEIEALGALEPFGRGNPRPRFLLERVVLTAPPRPMGSGDHLELWVGEPGGLRSSRGARSAARRAVWWNGAPFAHHLAPGEAIDLVVEAKIDSFRGRAEELLTIIDARVIDEFDEIDARVRDDSGTREADPARESPRAAAASPQDPPLPVL